MHAFFIEGIRRKGPRGIPVFMWGQERFERSEFRLASLSPVIAARRSRSALFSSDSMSASKSSVLITSMSRAGSTEPST